MIVTPHALEAIARLRVCYEAGVSPSPDVIEPILAHFAAADRAAQCRIERDAGIRAAAALLDGATWGRAQTLRKEGALLNLQWQDVQHQPPLRGTVRGELHRARLFAPLPASDRQYLRILQATCY